MGAVRRAFAWVGGAFGAAALLRFLRRGRGGGDGLPGATPEDPAAELRRRLAEARGAADDRDDYDAAEGVPVDAAEPTAPDGRSLEERRRAVHEGAQDVLDRMREVDPGPEPPGHGQTRPGQTEPE